MERQRTDFRRYVVRWLPLRRGSAVECVACLDLIELDQSAPRTEDAGLVLIRVLDALTALIRR